MGEFRVHQTSLLLLQGESRHGVINISVDHMILLKGTRLISNHKCWVGLSLRCHPYVLLTTGCLLGAHRFILSLMQLNDFVQAVIEICNLNPPLRLIVSVQRGY